MTCVLSLANVTGGHRDGFVHGQFHRLARYTKHGQPLRTIAIIEGRQRVDAVKIKRAAIKKRHLHDNMKAAGFGKCIGHDLFLRGPGWPARLPGDAGVRCPNGPDVR
jgi:hypothetical protein